MNNLEEVLQLPSLCLAIFLMMKMALLGEPSIDAIYDWVDCRSQEEMKIGVLTKLRLAALKQLVGFLGTTLLMVFSWLYGICGRGLIETIASPNKLLSPGIIIPVVACAAVIALGIHGVFNQK
jgi:hypothetical protein